jgi:hypothetical protein
MKTDEKKISNTHESTIKLDAHIVITTLLVSINSLNLAKSFLKTQ